MSNFFTKNNLSEILKDFKNENIKSLPCYHFMPQKDKSFSFTSDIKNTDEPVNQIISILISEENFPINEELENVYVVGFGTNENRTYHIVISNIPNKSETLKQIDLYERKGYMIVKTLSSFK
jgi:hypothetical protein